MKSERVFLCRIIDRLLVFNLDKWYNNRIKTAIRLDWNTDGRYLETGCMERRLFVIYLTQYDSSQGTKREDGNRQKLLSKLLLHYAMIDTLGTAPDARDLTYGSHGKPQFPNSGVAYNISNCRGFIACAIEKSEVGIDVERERPFRDALVRRVCTEGEYRQIMCAPNPALMFIRFWTLKESYVKYTGEGLGHGLKAAEFRFGGGQPYKVDEELFFDQHVLRKGRAALVLTVCTKEEIPVQMRFVEEKTLFEAYGTPFSGRSYINYHKPAQNPEK